MKGLYIVRKTLRTRFVRGHVVVHDSFPCTRFVAVEAARRLRLAIKKSGTYDVKVDVVPVEGSGA